MFGKKHRPDKQGTRAYATILKVSKLLPGQAVVPARVQPAAERERLGDIQSGALESSNVQPVVEISHMIDVMRAYQATATMTQSQQDLLRQAIDKLGGQPGS